MYKMQLKYLVVESNLCFKAFEADCQFRVDYLHILFIVSRKHGVILQIFEPMTTE